MDRKQTLNGKKIITMNRESLFQLWARIGVNFPAFTPSAEEPLVEELVAHTSLTGRYEPRLMEGMTGWMAKHGDLVNTSLMHRYLSQGNSAVLGLVFDIVDTKQSVKLKQLLKYCTPAKKAEMLFYAAENSPTMKSEALAKESAINEKWNLYYVSLRIKTDAVFERKEILKHNPNLARRALFGAGMRTEILNYLLAKGTSFPAEIAGDLGYRYHRIIEDIQGLIRDGAVEDRHSAKKRILKISPAFEKYLNVLPW
jgi:hypothetical protein